MYARPCRGIPLLYATIMLVPIRSLVHSFVVLCHLFCPLFARPQKDSFPFVQIPFATKQRHIPWEASILLEVIDQEIPNIREWKCSGECLTGFVILEGSRRKFQCS